MNFENYFKELLHINEATSNKLIDLYASGGKNLYLLFSNDKSSYFSQSLLADIIEVYGGKGHVLLRNSALNKEQIIGLKNRIVDWTTPDNNPMASELEKFISTAYKEIKTKGNNPIFLSVGAVKWKYAISAKEVKDVETPLIIFPIRLNRISATSPVHIEFVEDEVYINPCLVSALAQTLDDSIVKNFPHPNGVGVDLDTAIDLNKLQDGNAYFERIAKFFQEIYEGSSGSFLFEFLEDKCAISSYNHNEICMYYDIKRNKDRIINNELVKKVFSISNGEIPEVKIEKGFKSTQAYDTIQENIIRRAINGESMVIKGPPGTGKTLTISNMIGGFLAENKRILLVSKKLAALSEVYAKVDPVLRKFLLLLESESEAEAAKINSNEILKDLKEILTARKNYKFDAKYATATTAAGTTISSNIMALDKYYKILFDKNYLNELIKEANQESLKKLGLEMPESYYEILNTYFSHPEMPNLDFMPAAISLQIRKDLYNMIYADAKDLNAYYNLLTLDRSCKLTETPWYGCQIYGAKNLDETSINLLGDEIYEKFTKIKTSADVVVNKLNEIFNDLNIANLMLKTVHWLLDCNLTAEQIETVLAIKDYKKVKEQIYKSICSIEFLLKDASVNNFKSSSEEILEHNLKLAKLSVDKGLTYSEFNLIAKNLELFGENQSDINNEVITKIINVMNLVAENDSKIAEQTRIAYTIFKKDLDEKDLNTIYKFYEKIEGKDKIAFYDLGLKSLYKKVSEMSYLDSVSLEEVCDSSKAICEIKKLEDENKKLIREVSKVFQKELSDSETKVIKLVCDRSNKEQVTLQTYIGKIREAVCDVNKAFEMINISSDTTLDILFKHFELAHENNIARGILISNNIIFNEDANLFELIKSTYAVLILKDEIGVEDTNVEVLESIFAKLLLSKEVFTSNIKTIFTTINEIKPYFANSIYINNEEINIKQLAFFAKHCTDKEILSNYINYNKIKYRNYKSVGGDHPVLGYFLLAVEASEEINDHPLHLVFEHSFYNLMIETYQTLLPSDMKNNIGNYNEIKLNNCLEGFSNIEKANVYNIENALFQTIDLKDPAYVPFLNIERTNMSLRLLFKLYADAILRLKKAILISPSTVSLLFREEEFSEFDVAIIDEASQMTPVSLLPILFRTKQIIVVGDEYQMPPIRNFVRKSNDDSYTNVDEVMMPADSALSLILGCNSFRSYPLLCHYRSKTETLIKYSNEKHYADMRTFPAPIPKAADLGFRDIYIEGATGGSGRNKLEAEKCAELIAEHFAKYYDHKDKLLKESLGVIAFGENQVIEINKVLKKPEYKELSVMIEYARKNEPTGIEDKAFFLKTIETVQGQEADHVILSFTYGVDEDGKPSSSFGQLSKVKIGECIFNVAVTRAKKSVTVIHSFKGIDMKEGLNATFIAEYLKITEKYSGSVESSFEGVNPDLGFINDVKNYIVSLGIREDRVICDCGSNKGSVRIPIAILSRDKTTAICAIWAEKPPLGEYKYIDYNGRYYNVLKGYGWNLYKLFIHDWYINNESEKIKLKEYISKFERL